MYEEIESVQIFTISNCHTEQVKFEIQFEADSSVFAILKPEDLQATLHLLNSIPNYRNKNG